MKRVYFEPIDLEENDVEKIMKVWNMFKKEMLNKGILIPAISKINNIVEVRA